MKSDHALTAAVSLVQDFGPLALQIVAEHVDQAAIEGDTKSCDWWLEVATVIREATWS